MTWSKEKSQTVIPTTAMINYAVTTLTPMCLTIAIPTIMCDSGTIAITTPTITVIIVISSITLCAATTIILCCILLYRRRKKKYMVR